MEIDVAAGYNSAQDIDAMISMIGAEMSKFPLEPKLIIAADWRPCKLFTQEVADRAIKMLTFVNTRIERSAVLHREDAPTSVLQVMRLVRESKFDHRRLFTDPHKVEQWLEDILTPPERARLKLFLAQR
jgi:hypothetical protein